MTDTPSLLDRIKAAMRSYYNFGDIDGYAVVRADTKEKVEVCETWMSSVQRAADLNARAVIDAIVGAAEWRGYDLMLCGLIIGMIEDGKPWYAALVDHKSPVPFASCSTESEARVAVEAAFRAALMGDSNG